MAFATFTPATEPITLDERGRSIERRRAAAGDPPIPRNSGTRRTESKRALLKAIEEAGGRVVNGWTDPDDSPELTDGWVERADLMLGDTGNWKGCSPDSNN